MRSYTAIARETGTTVGQVRHAMACAKRSRDTMNALCPVDGPEWLVATDETTSDLFWFTHAQGWGGTREEAAIKALTSHAGLF